MDQPPKTREEEILAEMAEQRRILEEATRAQQEATAAANALMAERNAPAGSKPTPPATPPAPEEPPEAVPTTPEPAAAAQQAESAEETVRRALGKKGLNIDGLDSKNFDQLQTIYNELIEIENSVQQPNLKSFILTLRFDIGKLAEEKAVLENKRLRDDYYERLKAEFSGAGLNFAHWYGMTLPQLQESRTILEKYETMVPGNEEVAKYLRVVNRKIAEIKTPEVAAEPKEVKPASQPRGISEQDRKVLAEIREIVETSQRQIEERRERIEEIRRQEAEMEREIAELREQLAQKPAGDLEAEISQIQTELISNERKITFAGNMAVGAAIGTGVAIIVSAVGTFLLPEIIMPTLMKALFVAPPLLVGFILRFIWLDKKLGNLNKELIKKETSIISNSKLNS